MTSISALHIDARPALGPFLKMLRLRIPPTAPSLGPNPRLPIRLGRRVSQEEMAEVVGVSRNWYRRLESRQGVRASTKLLSRLAVALVVTPDEQVALFALAVPEIWPAEIYPDSRALAAIAPRYPGDHFR